MEAIHITSNPRSGKLGTINEDDDDDDDDIKYNFTLIYFFFCHFKHNRVLGEKNFLL